MAEQSVSTGAAAALRAGLSAKRARVARAQRAVDMVTARYRTAESRLLALQAAGASPTRVAAAKARTIELAHEIADARDAVAVARAPRKGRR